MKMHSAILVVVAAFAVSLPGMYFINHGKMVGWELSDTFAGADKEDKDDPVVDALCLKALMYLSDGHHDKAIAAYSEAIKRDPKYSFSYLGRGDAYLAKGDLQRALTDYDAAVRVDPENDAAKERADLVRKQQRVK